MRVVKQSHIKLLYVPGLFSVLFILGFFFMKDGGVQFLLSVAALASWMYVSILLASRLKRYEDLADEAESKTGNSPAWSGTLAEITDKLQTELNIIHSDIDQISGIIRDAIGTLNASFTNLNDQSQGQNGNIHHNLIIL